MATAMSASGSNPKTTMSVRQRAWSRSASFSSGDAGGGRRRFTTQVASVCRITATNPTGSKRCQPQFQQCFSSPAKFGTPVE